MNRDAEKATATQVLEPMNELILSIPDLYNVAVAV